MWLPSLPSAGGYVPVWQVAHCAVTGTWVWLKRLGRQPVVVWQLMQLVAPTGMCRSPLPVALMPLWQPVQLVAAVKVLWSTRAPAHVVVDRWQVSHTVCPRWMAVLGLIAAWQVAHCLLTATFKWNLAGVQAV